LLLTRLLKLLFKLRLTLMPKLWLMLLVLLPNKRKKNAKPSEKRNSNRERIEGKETMPLNKRGKLIGISVKEELLQRRQIKRKGLKKDVRNLTLTMKLTTKLTNWTIGPKHMKFSTISSQKIWEAMNTDLDTTVTKRPEKRQMGTASSIKLKERL
jgi:hypothetical protein